MKRENLEEKITAFILDVADIGEEELDMDMELIDEIGLSSIDVMDLVSRCEAEFRIKITSRDLRVVYTPGDLADLVEEKLTD